MIQIHINLKLIKKFLDRHGQKWVWLVGHKTLKLTRSQKGIDRMNWCFAGWCRSRKAGSHFTDLWVGLVKNGCNELVRETLKSAEWVYELSSIFACCLWCSNFWQTLYPMTLKCQSTAVVLVRPPAVTKRILWNRVCPSFPPAICLGAFLELDY